MSSVVGWIFLVLVVLALVAASAWRRRPAGGRTRSSLPAPPASDDLGSLGLSAPRPASPRPVAVEETVSTDDAPRAALPEEDDGGPSWAFGHEYEETPAPPARSAHAAVETAPVVEAPLIEASDEPLADVAEPAAPAPRFAAPLTSVRPAPAAVHPDSPLWAPPGPAEHLLASLVACTGGTVAVLRREGARYHVDALAGLDDDAWPAPIDASGTAHPLDRAPLDRLLSVLDGDDLGALPYLAPGTARAALVRALDETPEPPVLVVATLAVDADHVDAATARLVGDYVDLLASLRVPPAEVVADDRDDAPADATPDDVTLDADPARPADDDAPTRTADALPRSVILTGEIQAAREARRPLAFALVTLAHAEVLLDGPAADAAEAEAGLADRLAAAPRVRRVEPFGPLLFGVFLDATPDQVSPWARALSATGDALCVGAVAPAAGDADAVRTAATTALEDAYTQNAVCVVVD